MSLPLLSVYGTGGGDFNLDGDCQNPEHHWWHYREADGHDSAWWTFMRSLGCEPFSDRPFHWTGDLDGLASARWWPWNWFRRGAVRHRDWFTAGRSLADYIGPHARTFIAVGHSHGGNALLYAAAHGRRIPILVTVGTPYRSDMKDVIEQARPHIGHWVHVFDRGRDLIALGGQFGDGAIHPDRQQPRADVNLGLDNIDHSLILRDPTQFHYWTQILPAGSVA